MRAALRVLTLCLVALPTVAFADVYPLNPPPDLFIDNFNYEGIATFGTVESITDFGNCQAIPCFAGLEYEQFLNEFVVTDGVNAYLEGTLIGSQVEPGGEFGEEFAVTLDNAALWSAIEGQTPSSFGSEIVVDFHNFYLAGSGPEPDATADLTPSASVTTPEPASLTLLASGLAAGFVRRRRAAKKK